MTSIVEKHLGDRAPADAPFLPPPTRSQLPKQEVTIAEALKTAGYTTCLIGKWHLGMRDFGPLGHGFDVAIAPPHKGMPRSYFWPQWKGNPNIEGRFDGEYLTDRLTDEACRFIDQHHESPFSLFLCFHSVHVPIEAKKEKVARYENLLRADSTTKLQHHNPHYAAMVESVDDGVGRVLKTLNELKLSQNTLVVFFSDNGGLAHPSHVGDHTPATSNAPLRSGKGFIYEGGIREPLIVRWPGVVKAGSRSSVPIISNDFFPTLCEAAGVDLNTLQSSESIDGKSLITLLKGNRDGLAPRPLYWHYPHFSSMGGRPSGAMRSGRWKLIEHFETQRIELFDVADDIGETNDLSKTHPERARQLAAELAAWRERLGAGMPQRPNPKYRGNSMIQ
jgi:arylsulfatase A-like enzyme